jgi:hypothetical protein
MRPIIEHNNTKLVGDGYYTSESYLSRIYATTYVCLGLSAQRCIAVLYRSIIACLLLLAEVWSATPHGYSETGYPMVLSRVSAAGQDLTPDSVPATQFSLLLGTGLGEEVSLLPVSGVLSEADWELFNPARAGVSALVLRLLPLSAWRHYYYSDALQFHVSQFPIAADLTTIGDASALLFASARAELLPRLLTVVEIQGAFRLGGKDSTLHYALYAGTLAEGTPDDLIAGVRIGYTAGTKGFTVGVNYSYDQSAVRLEVLRSVLAPGELHWSGNDIGTFGIQLLRDRNGSLMKNQLPRGVPQNDDKLLRIHAKPALQLNQQWTVFYRIDLFHLGQGLPKSTEQGLGLKFLPTASINLRAEFTLKNFDNPSIKAGGLRFSGTIRF